MEDILLLAGAEALAHRTRLQIIRLLGDRPSGVSAGEIADTLGVKATTLSAHLAILSRTGLIEAVRHGKSLVYHYRPAVGRRLADAVARLL